MHNVDVDSITKTADSARDDPKAAWMDVHLEGTWNVDGPAVQFQGDVPFPQGTATFAADFPPFLGGSGLAPAALAYCFYGAMCCYGATFATQAAMAGMEIEAMQISLDTGVDFRPALGVAETDPLSDFKFRINVTTPASEEKVAEVKQLTDERCPAIWAMKNPVPHTIEVTKAS